MHFFGSLFLLFKFLLLWVTSVRALYRVYISSKVIVIIVKKEKQRNRLVKKLTSHLKKSAVLRSGNAGFILWSENVNLHSWCEPTNGVGGGAPGLSVPPVPPKFVVDVVEDAELPLPWPFCSIAVVVFVGGAWLNCMDNIYFGGYNLNYSISAVVNFWRYTA